MIFGPDFSVVVLRLAIAIPFSFAIFAASFFLLNACMASRRPTHLVFAAVGLQRALWVPLCLVLNWQRSIWFGDSSEIVWLVMPALTLMIGGVIASWVVFRVGFLSTFVVGLASSLLGSIGSLCVL